MDSQLMWENISNEKTIYTVERHIFCCSLVVASVGEQLRAICFVEYVFLQQFIKNY